MLLGRTLCYLIEKLRPKMGNLLTIYFWFLYILLILCLTSVSKKYYHGTVAYQLSEKHKVGLVIISCDNVVSDHGAAKA